MFKNNKKQAGHGARITLGPASGVQGKGGGGGGGCHPHKIFLEFFMFRDELSSPPAVFSGCAHIPYTHFDTRLVSIGCYSYEI